MLRTTNQPLPATKTHAKRSFIFFGPTADGFLGALSIRQGSKSDEYLIEEDTSEPYPGRTFLLARQTGDITPDRQGTYRVVCHTPDDAACNCSGYSTAKVCKHSDSVKALLADGLLDPEPDPPTHWRPTEGELPEQFQGLGPSGLALEPWHETA